MPRKDVSVKWDGMEGRQADEKGAASFSSPGEVKQWLRKLLGRPPDFPA